MTCSFHITFTSPYYTNIKRPMSFMQRTWLYITRKTTNTLILLCMSTIMLSGFAIKRSTNAVAQFFEITLTELENGHVDAWTRNKAY